MHYSRYERRLHWEEQERRRLEAARQHRASSDAPHYRERREVLELLGFRHYGEYLKSKHWAGIRAAVLAASPLCRACGHEARQVHHQSYDVTTMMGLDLTPLVSLCRKCHERVEFTCRGNKRTIVDARKTCDKLLGRLARRTANPRNCWVCGRKLRDGVCPCARHGGTV